MICGIALGYAITLGLYAFFGTLLPYICQGQIISLFHQPSGHVILPGVIICILGVAVSAAAGHSKEQEMTVEVKLEAGERDRKILGNLEARHVLQELVVLFSRRLGLHHHVAPRVVE